MNGVLIAFVPVFPYTGPRFVDVNIILDPDGTLDVEFDGLDIFTNLPTGHGATDGGQFVFGARTGGANSKHLIDNLGIETRPVPEPTTMALGLLAVGALFIGRNYSTRRVH